MASHVFLMAGFVGKLGETDGDPKGAVEGCPCGECDGETDSDGGYTDGDGAEIWLVGGSAFGGECNGGEA